MTTENNSAVDEQGFLKTDTPVTDGGAPVPPVAPAATGADSPQTTFEAPKKRGRGRPPKNPQMGAESIPAGSATGAKRGPKPKVSYSQQDYAAMGKQLVGIHEIIFMTTGIHEARISEEEGTALAQAIGNVSEQYGLAIDGKTGAALQLAATAAMIYGPRALQFRARVQKAKQDNGNVIVSNG